MLAYLMALAKADGAISMVRFEIMSSNVGITSRMGGSDVDDGGDDGGDNGGDSGGDDGGGAGDVGGDDDGDFGGDSGGDDGAMVVTLLVGDDRLG